MKATRQDITRLFRGVDEHTILELLRIEPSVSDLEAALLVMQGDDESLYGMAESRRQAAAQLASTLEQAGFRAGGDEDDVPRP